VDLGRQVDDDVAVVSLALSYSLTTPPRSATKMRRRGRTIAVGVSRPLMIVATWNPGSTTVASATPVPMGRAWANIATHAAIA
jgi:hypothetical protein